MSYMNCPHCRMSNKQSDDSCYNCEKPLHEGPELDEDGAPVNAPQLQGAPPPGQASKHFVERSDRSSTLVHGLRAGAVAGLTWGIFAAGARTMTGGALVIGIRESTTSGFLTGMAGIFFVLLLFHVVYGVILGAILAVTQRLCFQSDAVWLGGIFGTLVAIFVTGNWFTFFYWEAPLGAAAGGFISFVERSWFRKQYATYG